MTFTTEIALDVEVEVLDASRGTRGRHTDRPERSEPAEPDDITLAVWLGRDGGRINLAPHLPADVLEFLTEEALERLEDAR